MIFDIVDAAPHIGVPSYGHRLLITRSARTLALEMIQEGVGALEGAITRTGTRAFCRDRRAHPGALPAPPSMIIPLVADQIFFIRKFSVAARTAALVCRVRCAFPPPSPLACRFTFRGRPWL